MENLDEALFHGCNHFIYKESGAIQPMRFSIEEVEYYSNVGEVQKVRAYSTAGIKLSFYTSLEEIKLSFELFNFTYKKTSITLYENDEMKEIITICDDMQTIDIVYKKKNKGKVKIELYLPNVAGVALSAFNVEDATPVDKYEKTLLCLGDSITQGGGSEISSKSYANQLSCALNMELYNKGIGGYIFDVNSIVKTIEPDIITIAYGTNDFSQHKNVEITLKNARLYCEKIRELFPKLPIYLLTPLWRADLGEHNIELFQDITKGLEKIASENKMKSIVGFDIFPKNPDLFDDKRIHPNSNGYSILTEELLKVIK